MASTTPETSKKRAPGAKGSPAPAELRDQDLDKVSGGRRASAGPKRGDDSCPYCGGPSPCIDELSIERLK
jgi:hypothetical protein